MKVIGVDFISMNLSCCGLFLFSFSLCLTILMFGIFWTGLWSCVCRRWRIANCLLASLVSVTVGCPSSRISLSDPSLTGSLRGSVIQSLSLKCIQLHWAAHPRRRAMHSSAFETTVLKSESLYKQFKITDIFLQLANICPLPSLICNFILLMANAQGISLCHPPFYTKWIILLFILPFLEGT